MYDILDVEKHDYYELIELWEASVRATHDFLPEDEIRHLKPLILDKYFDAVTLKCIKDLQGNIKGFSGVNEGCLEMLFVCPSAQGKGMGSDLCQFAIENQGVSKVDVNEQNPNARVFYEKMGFTVISRSALDAQGKPYPILHMSL